MVTGLLGAFLDSVPRVAEEVLSTERGNVTTQRQRMEEKIVRGPLTRRWLVINFHVRVNTSYNNNVPTRWLNNFLLLLLKRCAVACKSQFKVLLF